MSVYFFIQDPAAAEIYTYRHTLSLHDALPIFVDMQRLSGGEIRRITRQRIRLEKGRNAPVAQAVPARDERQFVGRRALGRQAPGQQVGRRSEEHTSALQSLLRISYAVFCLTTQNSLSQQTRQEQVN